jgi:hypothetical protein
MRERPTRKGWLIIFTLWAICMLVIAFALYVTVQLYPPFLVVFQIGALGEGLLCGFVVLMLIWNWLSRLTQVFKRRHLRPFLSVVTGAAVSFFILRSESSSVRGIQLVILALAFGVVAGVVIWFLFSEDQQGPL